jgi:hypothetical protein
MWEESHRPWEASRGGRGGWALSHRAVGDRALADATRAVGTLPRPLGLPLRGGAIARASTGTVRSGGASSAGARSGSVANGGRRSASTPVGRLPSAQAASGTSPIALVGRLAVRALSVRGLPQPPPGSPASGTAASAQAASGTSPIALVGRLAVRALPVRGLPPPPPGALPLGPLPMRSLPPARDPCEGSHCEVAEWIDPHCKNTHCETAHCEQATGWAGSHCDRWRWRAAHWGRSHIRWERSQCAAPKSTGPRVCDGLSGFQVWLLNRCAILVVKVFLGCACLSVPAASRPTGLVRRLPPSRGSPGRRGVAWSGAAH